jgi:4-hydroxybutyrate CoA-transferase
LKREAKVSICQNAAELFSEIKSNDRLFIHGGAAFPLILIDGLVANAPRLRDVELIHLHTIGHCRYAEPEFHASFKIANLFVGENLRGQMDLDRCDYIPCFLSEIPNLFRMHWRPIDAALIHVSAPDRNGFCTLGTSVDVAKAAIDSAPLIIAQVNRQMPRVHGDGLIHISRIHKYIEVDEPLPEVHAKPIDDCERAIGRNVASLVADGATLQMGIGAIPDAVLQELRGHQHLGIHSEMWTDGAMELIKSGVVDNSQKATYAGRTVSGFVYGTRALYDFIDDNPSVIQLDTAYVNHPFQIARNPKVVAINSAVEIDLTGQICADSIGNKIISGVGGQVDFFYGASLSKGGKAIVALSSRTAKGVSKIVGALKPGAGVVTTRAQAHFIVTEYGIAELCGKTLGERARELIRIAHPDDRDSLEQAWRMRKAAL